MLDIDPKKLEKLVVDAAVDQVLSINDEDGEYDQFSRLLRKIDDEINSRIDKIFAERVEAIITKTVDEAIQEGFEREFRPVDGFGKPIGPKTTVKAQLENIIGDYWSERVDSHGKKTDSAYRSRTRAEYVLCNALGEDFAKEFKQQAVNAAAGLKDGLRNAMRAQMDAALGDVFNVKSKQDKEEGRRK